MMDQDLDKIKELVAETVEKETRALREEIKTLKEENMKLNLKVEKLERNVDEVEQYNRKSSLILGGAFPEGEEGEAPAKTRETAKKIIEEKLKVNLKGGIAACHRLKNKKRVIVKFQDLDDRDAVYQAKFDQEGDWKEKIAVHENLTERRARMVSLLEDMRKSKLVLNYHTKNGNIMARASADQKYARIDPWSNKDEIISTLQHAPTKTAGTNTQRRQGRGAYQAANLEPFVVEQARQTVQTRQAKKNEAGKESEVTKTSMVK